MRLIDANSLKPTQGMFIYQTEDRDTVIAVEAYRWELIEREAPTVEAIPVEWIEKYIKQNYCTCDLVYPEEFLKELVTWWGEEK